MKEIGLMDVRTGCKVHIKFKILMKALPDIEDLKKLLDREE